MPEKIIACYVARHGETVLNANGCFRGNANPELNKAGIAEAHRLGHYFSNIDISCVFCSDRVRATNTAEIISQAINVPMHTSESLRALDVGDFSGQKRTPKTEADLQCYLDQPDCEIPGGESLNDFKARIQPCIRQAVHIFTECGVPPLIVGHSSIIHECGSMLHGDHKSILVHPGGVIAIYFDGKGKLGAEPIYKAIGSKPGNRADTVS